MTIMHISSLDNPESSTTSFSPLMKITGPNFKQTQTVNLRAKSSTQNNTLITIAKQYLIMKETEKDGFPKEIQYKGYTYQKNNPISSITRNFMDKQFRWFYSEKELLFVKKGMEYVISTPASGCPNIIVLVDGPDSSENSNLEPGEVGGCSGTEYGCCPDGVTSSNATGSNCAVAKITHLLTVMGTLRS